MASNGVVPDAVQSFVITVTPELVSPTIVTTPVTDGQVGEAVLVEDLEHRIESMDMQDKIFQVVVPTEEEIELKDGQELTIWGVVTSVIQRFKR